MWQRIQTIFLVVAIASLLLSIFFPVWQFVDPQGTTHELYPLHYSQVKEGIRTTQYFPYSVTAMFSIAAATLAFIEIGKYKNRVLQMKMGAFNSLFLLGVVGSSVYFASKFINSFGGGEYGLGLYVPAVAVICNLIANRFIRRDEKLVRDSERLR